MFGQKCRQCRQRYIPPALVRTALMRAMNLAVLIFTERIHGLDCAPPPFLGRAGGQQHLKELCEECVWQQHDSPEIEWGLNMCRDAESRQAAPAPALRDVHDVRRHAAQAAPAAHAPAAAGPSSPSPTTGTASSAGPASEAEVCRHPPAIAEKNNRQPLKIHLSPPRRRTPSRARAGSG